MALVVAGGASGSGWGTLTTQAGSSQAPLPNCLARLVQNKNQVLPPGLRVSAPDEQRSARSSSMIVAN